MILMIFHGKPQVEKTLLFAQWIKLVKSLNKRNSYIICLCNWKKIFLYFVKNSPLLKLDYPSFVIYAIDTLKPWSYTMQRLCMCLSWKPLTTSCGFSWAYQLTIHFCWSSNFWWNNECIYHWCLSWKNSLDKFVNWSSIS